MRLFSQLTAALAIFAFIELAALARAIKSKQQKSKQASKASRFGESFAAGGAVFRDFCCSVEVFWNKLTGCFVTTWYSAFSMIRHRRKCRSWSDIFVVILYLRSRENHHGFQNSHLQRCSRWKPYATESKYLMIIF